MQTYYFLASAEEFIEALTTAADDEKFFEMAPSLARADDAVFDATIPQLLGLLQHPNEQTRRRTVTALRFLQQLAPARMQSHADAIVAAIIPLLDDMSSGVEGEALHLLEHFGTAARSAAGPLEQKMSDDREWWAPQAAVTLAAVNPMVDIGPRLIELVQRKHPNWYSAAFVLSKHVSPQQARTVLTELYESADNEGDRNALIQALNQIKPD